MKQHRKLIVAGVLAAALACGGAGVAMASDGGGHAGTGKGQRTESYRVAHKKGNGPEEKGFTRSTADDGKPGLNQDGTPPSHGGKPDTHSYPTN